jgi:hypothetical protein
MNDNTSKKEQNGLENKTEKGEKKLETVVGNLISFGRNEYKQLGRDKGQLIPQSVSVSTFVFNFELNFSPGLLCISSSKGRCR